MNTVFFRKTYDKVARTTVEEEGGGELFHDNMLQGKREKLTSICGQEYDMS